MIEPIKNEMLALAKLVVALEPPLVPTPLFTTLTPLDLSKLPLGKKPHL